MSITVKQLTDLAVNCVNNHCSTCEVEKICNDIRTQVEDYDKATFPCNWTEKDIKNMVNKVPVDETKFNCYIPPNPEKAVIQEDTYNYFNIVKALEFARKLCEEDDAREDGDSRIHCPLGLENGWCIFDDCLEERNSPVEWDDDDIIRIADNLIKKEPKQEIIDIIEYLSGFKATPVVEHDNYYDSSTRPTYISVKEFEDNFISDEPMKGKFPSPSEMTIKTYLRDLIASITKTPIEQAPKEQYTYEEVKKVLKDIRDTCIKQTSTNEPPCSNCPYKTKGRDCVFLLEGLYPSEWHRSDIEDILNKYFPEHIEIPKLITNTIDKQRLIEELPF